MKNLKIQALLLTLCICFVVMAALHADSQIGSVITRPGSSGFKAVTTQNLTIATNSASLIGTMPVNCRQITVTAKDATMYYGDANVAANGLYPSITSGNSVTFDDIDTRTPSIYFIALATATGKIGIVAR